LSAVVVVLDIDDGPAVDDEVRVVRSTR